MNKKEFISLIVLIVFFALFFIVVSSLLILKIKKLKRELYYVLNHDELTGLLNRNGFLKETYKIIHESKKQYVLVFGNIRNFKNINEIYGKNIGDEILKMVGNELIENSSLLKIISRMDADRFCALIEKDNFDINNVINGSKRNIYYNCIHINFHVRYGIYYINDLELPVQAMCDRAMLAKNFINDEYFEPYAIFNNSMLKGVIDLGFVENNFANSLKKGEIKVYFQPIVNCKTKKIVAAEALVRWIHPTRGVINPSSFIPYLENTALITLLDTYVVKEVIEILEQRCLEHKDIIPISINFSRINFYREELIPELLELIDKHNINKEYIHLEITESAYSVNPIVIDNQIKILRKNSIKILLDDFGCGYSSFSSLDNINIDFLKIDMRFIVSLMVNQKAKIIVSSLIKMCHELGIKTIAEGVETIEEYQFLLENDCDYIQGFYFYKPMNKEAFIKLLD